MTGVVKGTLVVGGLIALAFIGVSIWKRKKDASAVTQNPGTSALMAATSAGKPGSGTPQAANKTVEQINTFSSILQAGIGAVNAAKVAARA